MLEPPPPHAACKVFDHLALRITIEPTAQPTQHALVVDAPGVHARLLLHATSSCTRSVDEQALLDFITTLLGLKLASKQSALLRCAAQSLLVSGPLNPPAPPAHVSAANTLNDAADALEGLPVRWPLLFAEHDGSVAALIERVYRLEEIIARMIDAYRHQWGERAITWATMKLAALRPDDREDPHAPAYAWPPPRRELERIAACLEITVAKAQLAYEMGMRAPSVDPHP